MAPPSVSPTLTRELVLAILPPLRQDPQVLKQVTDHIAKEVKADVQGSSRMTWDEVGLNVAGLARTARVRVQSDLADALDKAVFELGRHRRAGQSAWEGDMPIKMSNLSQHVQFLLAMACQPTTKTHELAHGYLHRQPALIVDEDRKLYDEIMEAPFEGDHWQERYELEVEGWSDSDDDRVSSDSGGPEEAIITPRLDRPAARLPAETRDTGIEDRDRRMQQAERELKDLRKGAYWITGGEDVEAVKVKEGWRSVSTGISVASLSLALDEGTSKDVKAITGIQFQRELLFALSGRPGVVLGFKDASCFIFSDHPTVHHYSPDAVESILSTFQHRSTQASAIRRLIRNTLSPVGSSTSVTPTRTTQAFAEACRSYMTTMDDWVANLELAIVRGSNISEVSTPLSLRLELDMKFGNMLDHLSSVLPYADEPILLLNAIHAILQTLSTDRRALCEVFITTVAPLWETLGDWLMRGMPIPRSLIDVESRSDAERPLDREFWISRDQDVSWADEDFWDAAFILQNDRPDWIDDELLEATLEAGKARGLLRGLLGYELTQGEDEDWTPLSDLLGLGDDDDRDDPSGTIARYLSPRCQMTTFHLRRVLDEDCGLQAHLEAIDGLFYHKGIDAIQSWRDWLFSQVVSRKRWSDFQILTSTLREHIEKRGDTWLNPAAIRIDPGSGHKRAASSTISPAMFSTLRPSYRIPFPLSQLFTSTSLDLRGDVFTFLLQVQFGRYLLARTRLLESRLREGISALLGLRHRLSFVINTIWTWITERVIQLETEQYKVKLDETTSFGSMIQLELHHVRRIRVFSFQHAKTSSINESVSSVLEMTADLHDLFVTLDLETQSTEPEPVSRATVPTPKSTPKDQHVQGRSRRRMNRNQHNHKRHQDLSSESDDSSDSDHDSDQGVANRTLKAEISFVELSLDERVKRLGNDLDENVKIIQEGLEALSTEGDEDEVDNWQMLSFALQDWR